MRGDRGGREGTRGEMRGGREGMRGDRRGGGVDVRVGGGDRGYRYGHRRGYGVYVHGGRCRTVIVKKRIGYHVVIKRIRRCF